MALGQGLSSLIPPRDKRDSEQEVERTLPEENTQPIPTRPQAAQQLSVEPNQGKHDTEQSIFQIEVGKIHPNPYQPRSEHGERGIQELAQSIREVGILQPLIVSKIENETNYGTQVSYQLIAGERRLRAAKLAGLERVPTIVRRVLIDRDKLSMALIENIQRLNLNPIEMARAYARLQDEFGLTQKEIATRIGKSRELVANSIRLLNLPSHIQDALAAGSMNESQARVLLSIKDPAEQEKVFQEIITNKTSAKQLRKYRKRKDDTGTAERGRQEQFWEQQLEERLGMPVSVNRKGEKGKVSISFFSEEEWRELLNRLLGNELTD